MPDSPSKPKKQSTFNPFAPATVDDGVRSLVVQFGMVEVKAAIKRVPTRKGNLPVKTDREKLLKNYYEDAEKWLAGEDPFTMRSSYSIAKAIASKEPAHMRASVHRRILRKLQHDRKFYTYYIASVLAADRFPHGIYRNAISAAMTASSFLANKAERITWQKNLALCNELLEREIVIYVERYKVAVASDISLKKIKEANNILNLLKPKMPAGIGLGGLFGSGTVTK